MNSGNDSSRTEGAIARQAAAIVIREAYASNPAPTSRKPRIRVEESFPYSPETLIEMQEQLEKQKKGKTSNKRPAASGIAERGRRGGKRLRTVSTSGNAATGENFGFEGVLDGTEKNDPKTADSSWFGWFFAN